MNESVFVNCMLSGTKQQGKKKREFLVQKAGFDLPKNVKKKVYKDQN